MDMDFPIRTAQAAFVAGMSYDGFRTWMKRGWLRKPDSPDRLVEGSRRWAEFTFPELCASRLLRVLLQTGMPFEEAVDVASVEKLVASKIFETFVEDARRFEREVRRYLVVHRLKVVEEHQPCFEWKYLTVQDVEDTIALEIRYAQHTTLVDVVCLKAEATALMRTFA